MQLIEEDNLQALGQQMKHTKLGLMIMFHAPYCDYCERLEGDLLLPMLRSVEYDKKVLIRKVKSNPNGF